MGITGFKELSDQLDAMSRSAQGKALKSATGAAMSPVLRAAKANAPVGDPPYLAGERALVDPYPRKTYLGRLVTPGFTRRSIGRKTLLSRKGTLAISMVGVAPEAFYALQFLELGTSKFPKRPWLEPSFRQSKDAVDAALRSELKKRIDKAAQTGKEAIGTAVPDHFG